MLWPGVLGDMRQEHRLTIPSCQEPQRETLLRLVREADAARSTSIRENRGRGALTGLGQKISYTEDADLAETVGMHQIVLLLLSAAAKERPRSASAIAYLRKRSALVPLTLAIPRKTPRRLLEVSSPNALWYHVRGSSAILPAEVVIVSRVNWQRL